MRLENSVILITGAASKVGRTLALSLAERGAHIAFSWYFADEPWQSIQAEIEAFGVQCYVQQCDFTDSGQIRALIRDVYEFFGRIDVLINSVSIGMRAPVLDISDDEWDMTMAINVRGPFIATKAAGIVMLKHGSGVILNLADLAAFEPWPEHAHYSASKAALISLTRSLAIELAPYVRVNAIVDGTGVQDDVYTSRPPRAVEKHSLLKHTGTPADIAHAAIFLIENNFTTGTVMVMDGGRSLV